mmetsp:Transcript_6510/g.12265  ORF Transcript_6510/g.12265 Transcript_6510/m.12265 type:complete len:85 (-) Transcript_6510:1096-1350(-)
MMCGMLIFIGQGTMRHLSRNCVEVSYIIIHHTAGLNDDNLRAAKLLNGYYHHTLYNYDQLFKGKLRNDIIWPLIPDRNVFFLSW